MIRTLAFRHLGVRRVRSAFLLFGFAVGVATMIVLLSVGEAMLSQSRDVALVGGGDVTVVPQGVDLEALRTGALTGMYFGIDRARYVTRVAVGGPRQAAIVRAVAPVLEGKLLYLTAGGRTAVVRAGGEIPSQAVLAGAPLDLRAGTWSDSPADSAWTAPSAQQLYDQLDRWHRPAEGDSTWGEWHYFNVVTAPDEWWYITYLVAGDIAGGRWGGQLLLTRRSADGRHTRYVSAIPAEEVRFDTAGADLRLGQSTVQQRSGLYFLDGSAEGDGETARFRLTLVPEPLRYFPPVELASDGFVSGYVVPGLRARVTGEICLDGACAPVTDAPGYHDHNWGVWGGVTWEWGNARGRTLDLVYGGVARDSTVTEDSNPYFLAVVDSLGPAQVLRFGTIRYEGRRPVPGAPGVEAPARFTLVARRDGDHLSLDVDVLASHASQADAAGTGRWFLQMRGRFRTSGVISGRAVADSGTGFFETWIAPRP